MREVTEKLLRRENLTEEEAARVMEGIMAGERTPVQVAGFLVALRAKVETAAEISGFARTMRRHAAKVTARRDPLVDTCGTGGDGSGTFNISTAAAFVVAGAGVAVAKHGNRAASSRSGSADVLEALGVRIDLGPDEAGESIEQVGLGFLFAPGYHPSMRHAAVPRRELGLRTVFNVLGPLTNPAGAQVQLVGVYAPELTEVLAEALLRLGSRSVLVVHGAGRLDEISTLGPTQVSQGDEKGVRTFEVTPEEVGLRRAQAADLAGGTPADNAAIIEGILAGEKGPRRDVVALNAGAALWAAGVADGLAEGVRLAEECLDTGRARAVLEALRDRGKKAGGAGVGAGAGAEAATEHDGRPVVGR